VRIAQPASVGAFAAQELNEMSERSYIPRARLHVSSAISQIQYRMVGADAARFDSLAFKPSAKTRSEQDVPTGRILGVSLLNQ
jgi:hypothetical protein